jgi:hypothetical protein
MDINFYTKLSVKTRVAIWEDINFNDIFVGWMYGVNAVNQDKIYISDNTIPHTKYCPKNRYNALTDENITYRINYIKYYIKYYTCSLDANEVIEFHYIYINRRCYRTNAVDFIIKNGRIYDPKTGNVALITFNSYDDSPKIDRYSPDLIIKLNSCEKVYECFDPCIMWVDPNEEFSIIRLGDKTEFLLFE